MSYSRWSDDCDLYVYQSMDGIAIHVVNGPSLYIEDREEAASEIEWLAAQGYRFPADLADAVRSDTDD